MSLAFMGLLGQAKGAGSGKGADYRHASLRRHYPYRYQGFALDLAAKTSKVLRLRRPGPLALAATVRRNAARGNGWCVALPPGRRSLVSFQSIRPRAVHSTRAVVHFPSPVRGRMRRNRMSISRRKIVVGTAATLSTLALGLPSIGRAQSKSLKISHQFPGGSLTEGDFRDRLCRRFAADVEKQHERRAQVRGLSELVADEDDPAVLRAAQRRARPVAVPAFVRGRRGARRPTSASCPALVTYYEVRQSSWKNAEVGKLLTQILADKGIIVVSWIWQAGGVASQGKAAGARRRTPKGMKVRGGSREMDMMLKDCRRIRAVAAVQRDLRGDADRRDGRGASRRRRASSRSDSRRCRSS